MHEGDRRIPGVEEIGAARWHRAEEGAYVDRSQDAAATSAAKRPRGLRLPTDPEPLAFDPQTPAGRELNAQAERVKTAVLSLGRTLAHVSPTRHTVYVMGRPVQATLNSETL